MGVSAINVPPSRKANKALVADFFGVAITSVDGWVRRGCPYVQRGERGTPWVFDLLQLAEWRFGGQKSAAEEVDPEDRPPKERRDWYEGDQVRIELEVRKGNLITLDEYREEMARMLKHVAHAFETLPDVLERKCALDAGTVVTMQSEIDGVRSWLADSMEYHGTVIE